MHLVRAGACAWEADGGIAPCMPSLNSRRRASKRAAEKRAVAKSGYSDSSFTTSAMATAYMGRVATCNLKCTAGPAGLFPCCRSETSKYAALLGSCGRARLALLRRHAGKREHQGIPEPHVYVLFVAALGGPAAEGVGAVHLGPGGQGVEAPGAGGLNRAGCKVLGCACTPQFPACAALVVRTWNTASRVVVNSAASSPSCTPL